MESEADVPGRVHFLCNVCHVCKSGNPKVCCEICKMMYYCSAEHRRHNWRDHSQICRAVYKICQNQNLTFLYNEAVNLSGEGFKDLRQQTAMKCSEFLSRALDSWEYEFLYYPRLCNVCRDWKNLQACQQCGYIYTCEKGHFRKDHGRWCSYFKTYCDLIVHGCPDIRDFQLTLESSMNKILKTNHSLVENAMLSELLTYPLTVLHGLQIVERKTQPSLVIHLVGAELQAEVQPIEKWEHYLLHLLKDVQTLTLVFVGPELKWVSEKRQWDLCCACRTRNQKLNIEFVAGKLYHEFVQGSPVRPDFVCAFNSGMYRPNGFSWKETINELFSPGKAPVLITEYTSHELVQDLKSIKMDHLNLKLLVEPSANPFSSVKPGLNIISEEDSPIIFKNYYYTILDHQ